MTTSAPILDSHQLAARVKQRAREMGFDLVGIAPADPSRYGDYLRQWLDEGQAGTMRWLTQRFEERTNPAAYVTDARSIICVGMNYHVALDELPEADRPHRGKIARYALGSDYHELIKSRLHALADWIREVSPGAVTRACVDTAPVMEKEVSARAGVGWLGKNTCIIHERIGSWLLLGEIVTTLALPHDDPAIDRCGTCTRCIDACPTGAITAPYQLDARKCISYLTIEHREEIDPDLSHQIGEWVYGCDICQDVCPWNKRAPEASDPSLQPRFRTGTIDLNEVLRWSDEDYRRELKGSAMKRVKLPVLKRNAAVVLKNH
ncbi:MAG TPA: tRNA epoxyqueuosine(34) reductase QueG [Tepidisphaeraceae bacterium]|jgi:epoxyqueuosine reductase|nr:tRNA epoxyqueuosine(34) reductase QueG [Tepidisphaeraceae bacterium]